MLYDIISRSFQYICHVDYSQDKWHSMFNYYFFITLQNCTQPSIILFIILNIFECLAIRQVLDLLRWQDGRCVIMAKCIASWFNFDHLRLIQTVFYFIFNLRVVANIVYRNTAIVSRDNSHYQTVNLFWHYWPFGTILKPFLFPSNFDSSADFMSVSD